MPPADSDLEPNLDVLARRGRVRAVVLDAPAGHGRSELLHRALEQPAAGVRDVVLPPPVASIPPALLVDGLASTLGPSPETAPGTDLDRAVRVLDSAVAARGALCVCIDQVHRGGDDLLRFLGDLVRSLPADAHLLLAGAGLVELGVAELVADGQVLRLDACRLGRVRADPDLDRQVLSEAAERDVRPAVRRLLGCMVALDQSRRDAAEVILDVVAGEGARGSVDELARLPDVVVGAEQVLVGSAWSDVAPRPPERDVRAGAAAAAGVHLGSGDLTEAGRLSIVAEDPGALRRVVRAALAAQPPTVGAHALRRWHESALLPADDPHSWWLDAACRALHGDPLEHVRERYDQARRDFARTGDVDAELATGMALGIVARRLDDLATLAALVERAREVAGTGDQRAVATGMLGDALLAQMCGEPERALAVLDRVPIGSLQGDWAAQLAMMRGTNLLLCGRLDEAVAQLDAATGSGSAWSYATALQLLGVARWAAGDTSVAVDDLASAASTARQVGALAAADLAAAIHTVMAAALALPGAAEALSTAAGSIPRDQESVRLLDAARVLVEVGRGDLASAARLASALEPPERAVLSAHWTVALVAALAPDRDAEILPLVRRHPSLEPAWRSGQLARAHLDGGPRAPSASLAHLPIDWCERAEPEVRISLLGTAAVRSDGRPVDHPAWDRSRVRELCCYLAMCPGGSRELAAHRLWPDLDHAAASRNLRVTLSHLLDVLDPDRRKGEGSELLVDTGGTIALSDSRRLRIDVRDESADARDALEACAANDEPAAIAAARRLARRAGGPLLGGSALGGWADAPDRARREQLLSAVSELAPVVLRNGDPSLGEQLARRGLAEDPWAERLHQLLVRARLERDDLDGARRAMRAALDALDELEVQPEQTSLRLARDLGLDQLARR